MIRKILRKIILWCMDGEEKSSTSDVFNSIRINALTDELCDKGIIDTHKYEDRIKKSIDNIIGGMR